MRSFLQFLFFFLIIAIFGSLVIVMRYETSYPKTLGASLDWGVRTTHSEGISDQQPEIVLMGDSTLKLAVDFDQLASKLGVGTYGIAIPGSSSAFWYLVVKNNIAVADFKPDYLAIFFRESMLTTPDYRVGNRYFVTIDEFASPEDELLIQLSYLSQLNRLERLAERYLPLFGERDEVHISIDYRIDHTLPLSLFDCGEVCVLAALREVFTADVNVEALNLEQDATESYLWLFKNLLFQRQLKRSYLPEIVRIAQENEIQLIFVEVKTLVSPGSSTTALLRNQYFQALHAYAAENDIPIISFAGDPRLPAEYFFDNFHLYAFAKPIFTDLLAEELKPLIEGE